MREDLAEVAGFFNGEGCTYLSIQRSGVQSLQLIIGNTNLEYLEYIQSIIGGNIYKSAFDKRARKQSYRLTFYGFERVQAVIAALWFRLSFEKQEQAAEAIRDRQTWRRQKPAVRILKKRVGDILPILRGNK